MATQHPGRKRTLSLLVLAGLFLAGCSGDDIVDPEVDRTAIQGIVAGEDGNAYPSVTVALRHAGSAADLQSKTTGFNGSYEFTNLAAGSYEVALEPPRASEVVSTNPAAVTVAEGTTARADITIRPLPMAFDF